ncbi:WD40 repeat-like protein [Suillus decipiens]|nr:WD40 repeat-like protein [Suillus decipiens]
MAALIPNTTPIRAFEDHGDRVIAVAALPDERMVTASYDRMLRLWDLKTDIVLKKMEGHRSRVRSLAASPDGKWIASGDESGELIVRDGKTGEPLNQAIKAHDGWIFSLDFSSNSMALASGSSDTTTKLWTWRSSESTWKEQHSLSCGGIVRCIRYSPYITTSSGSGRHHRTNYHVLLAIATDHNVQIYSCILGYNTNYNCNYDPNHDFNPPFPTDLMASIGGGFVNSLAWTGKGSWLLSGSNGADPTIRAWDTSTWQQVGDPWKGHFKNIHAISLNPSGTLLASASHDNRVRLWRLSDRQTIAIFKHSGEVNCVMFSADDKSILSGGADKKILEWPISLDTLPEDGPKDSLMMEQATHQAQGYSDFKILSMNPTVRNACIVGDLPTAEKMLNLDLYINANDHTAYAHRAFIMARRCNWDQSLEDAVQSVTIQPSLAGHISQGIALSGKKQVLAARISFDLASMFTNRDSMTNHFLFLIKTIALFNANEHQEAMIRIGELATCPNVDPVACRIVETYLRVQLGNIALDGGRHNEAVEHFTAAVNASSLLYKLPIHLTYDEFVVLFGWDLKSLWHTANQQHCYALFRAGSLRAAIESYQFIMDKTDEDMKAGLRAGFTALK